MSGLNIDRFQQYIDEGRIASGRWLDTDERGREIACFYAALAPDDTDRTEPSACPAEALQPWIAHLLPWLDDSAATGEERYARARRLVPVLRRVALPEHQEALRRADYACRAIAVREARQHATGDALAAIDGVLLLLDRAAAGETGAANEWSAAAAAAAAAREAAAAAVEAAARAAAADRIAGGILSALEAAVGLAEAA